MNIYVYAVNYASGQHNLFSVWHVAVICYVLQNLSAMDEIQRYVLSNVFPLLLAD